MKNSWRFPSDHHKSTARSGSKEEEVETKRFSPRAPQNGSRKGGDWFWSLQWRAHSRALVNWFRKTSSGGQANRPKKPRSKSVPERQLLWPQKSVHIRSFRDHSISVDVVSSNDSEFLGFCQRDDLGISGKLQICCCLGFIDEFFLWNSRINLPKYINLNLFLEPPVVSQKSLASSKIFFVVFRFEKNSSTFVQKISPKTLSSEYSSFVLGLKVLRETVKIRSAKIFSMV